MYTMTGQKNLRRRGFSLVELLAVIAIIGIMAAVIGGFQPNESSSIKAGQRVTSSMFQAARTIATMRRTEARVIIYADGTEADRESKLFRYMGVVYWDDANQEWVAGNAGAYLPDGVYYVPDANNLVEAGPDASSSDLLFSSAVPEMEVAFPVSTNSEDEWYYYSFDGAGNARSTDKPINTTPQSFAGKIVVLASGRLSPPGGEQAIIIDNPFATAGLAVRRIGGTMALADYDYLQDALDNTNN